MPGTLTKGNTVRLARSFPALAAHRDGVGLDLPEIHIDLPRGAAWGR